MLLFTAFGLALLIAMAAGQFWVAYRAINHSKAGILRFTYFRAEAPLRFWTMAILEWIGFGLLFVFGMALLTGVLFQ